MVRVRGNLNLIITLCCTRAKSKGLEDHWSGTLHSQEESVPFCFHEKRLCPLPATKSDHRARKPAVLVDWVMLPAALHKGKDMQALRKRLVTDSLTSPT